MDEIAKLKAEIILLEAQLAEAQALNRNLIETQKVRVETEGLAELRLYVSHVRCLYVTRTEARELLDQLKKALGE